MWIPGNVYRWVTQPLGFALKLWAAHKLPFIEFSTTEVKTKFTLYRSHAVDEMLCGVSKRTSVRKVRRNHKDINQTITTTEEYKSFTLLFRGCVTSFNRKNTTELNRKFIISNCYPIIITSNITHTFLNWYIKTFLTDIVSNVSARYIDQSLPVQSSSVCFSISDIDQFMNKMKHLKEYKISSAA